MRILRVEAENFASYEKLSFDFTNQGLTLIQGANGAGKSTLCDLTPWCLWGQTAKGGAVSEVLSWPGDKVTKVTLFLENVTICRARGKAKDNDLWWDIGQGPQRGKDLIDTQKLLNGILGITYDTYMAGAYYHEFSQTAQFFNTTAKNRRLITEELVDLTLATTLQAKTSEVKKTAVKDLSDQANRLSRLTARLDATRNFLKNAQLRHVQWEIETNTRNANIQAKYDKFEQDREFDLNEARRALKTHKDLIQPLPDTDLYPKCPTCGQDTESPEVHAARHQKAINDRSQQRIEILSEKIKEIKLRVNPHKTENVPIISPYAKEIADLETDNANLDYERNLLQSEIDELASKVEDLELLQEVIADYRTTTIKNAISSLKHTTNELLTEHFDAELRIAFSAEDADKLEVEITKDGNRCSFTQLSKGQRCILKLCFGVAVMRAVETNNAVSFPQVFFDEALDGLSDTFKYKAFSLLQKLALSKESIFIVEHSEAFKSLFDSAYTVSLVNGVSQIEKA